MEDVSDLFKRHFSLLHKGTAMVRTVQDRKEVLKNTRKAKRDTLASIRRNIENLSPINTPTPVKSVKGKVKNVGKTDNDPEKKADSSIKPKQGGGSARLELLRKWKAEKAKMKELEKAKAKPIFKVYHVPSHLTADLENANKVIKGKPIVPGSAHKSQFAPPNHKFKPPSGIYPQSTLFASTSTSSKLRSTPQARTRNDLLIKKPISEQTPGSSKQEPSTSRSILSRNPDEKNSKPDIKKNAKETAVSKVDKFNKDKGDSLMVEVEKKATTTSDKTKVNKNVKTNLDSKKANSTSTTLKKNTPVPTSRVTRNSKKTGLGKITNAKDQETPKKAVSSSVKTSHKNKRPGDSDSNSNITSRKTPKKSKVLTESDQKELAIKNKKSSVTASLKVSMKDSPMKTPIEDNLPTSNDVQPATKPVKSHAGSSSSSLSTDYSVDYDNLSSAPLSSVPPVFDYNKSPPIYVSPFVTISRGKNSARKEYKIRRSLGTCEIDKDTPEVKKILSAHTSPKAGAVYFKRKLDAEIERINNMCNDWETYLEQPNLPEEACSTIDVAIGQSKLLISKKFQQFLGLISECETENYTSKPVTCEDLHGFWDMLYIQVGDLDKRFANLQRLRDNNWEEILPQKVIPVKRARGRPKKASATSKLTQMIEEARKRRMQDQQAKDIDLINGLDYAKILQTPPGEKLVEESSATKRKSSRVSVLKENKSRCSSSPGLTMMKVTQSIKQGDGLTPARSILKSDVFRSTGKKSVVFKEVEESSKNMFKAILFQEDEKENVSDNLIDFSLTSVTPRRSIRISQLKM